MDYRIKLDIFEGPLDLLLYLIQKNELDVHDIPITLITEQYLEYLNLMQIMNLDFAGEFLVMSSMLMRIKSKMLLPADETEPEVQDEEDPREELVQKLLEYMRFKQAATQLREKEELRSDMFGRYPQEIEVEAEDSPFLEISLFDLITAFSKVLKDMPKDVFHNVIQDEFTVAEKVSELQSHLNRHNKLSFSALFLKVKNKLEAITLFLALLELVRLKVVTFSQNRQFDEIEIVKASERESSPPSRISRQMGEGADSEQTSPDEEV